MARPDELTEASQELFDAIVAERAAAEDAALAGASREASGRGGHRVHLSPW